jgi:signal transduction histidine kinase
MSVGGHTTLRRIVLGGALLIAGLMLASGFGLLQFTRDMRSELEHAGSLSFAESTALHARAVVRLRQVHWALGVLGVAFLGGLYIFARLLRQRILTPLEALRDAAARIGNGDFSARVAVTSHDELGELTASFNQMAASLSSLQEKRVADLSQRRAAESALRDSEERLQQSQKMEAVGRLAGGVAHDFNNLLTVISCCSEMALARVHDDEILRQDLIEVRLAGQRAADLTRQLLAFGRKQVMRPEALDLDEVVAENSRMLRRLIGEHVRIEHAPAHETLWVEADRGQLGQVLLNLVVNARDAMPEGGLVTITTDRVTVGVEAELGGDEVSSGDYAVMVVRDQGMGMDEDTRVRAFEPFFTTKDAGQGTGLGLSTVYGIVRQSDGYITVESTPGTGTTFTVYLPLALERMDDQLPTSPGKSIAPASGRIEAQAPQKRRTKSVK